MRKSGISRRSKNIIWMALALLGLMAIAMIVCPCCFYEFDGFFYCYEGKLGVIS